MTGAAFELIASLVIVAFIIIAVAVSKSWYKEKFRLSKTTLYKDKKELTGLYPQIVWIK